MLQFINVTKKFPNGTIALKNINVEIKKGDFVFLVGSNGAGKSTFLRMVFYEDYPSTGTLIFNGHSVKRLRKKEIPKLRRKIGVVFQDYKLLPNLTVAENIAFALRVTEMSSRKINRRVAEVLEIVGMSHRKNSYPNSLSGGEKQRTAIGRAIANRPLLLVADEPTGNLDPEMTKTIMALFKKINLAGTTIIMATHDKQIVNAMRRRVVALHKGEIVSDQQRGGYINESAYMGKSF